MKKAFLPALIFALVSPQTTAVPSTPTQETSLKYIDALQIAKDGIPVVRSSWNHTGRVVWDEPSGRFYLQHGDQCAAEYRPTQSDMMALDWALAPSDPQQVGLQSFNPLSFAQAIDAMKEGQLLTRGAWADGKVIWLHPNPTLYLQAINGNRAATVEVLQLTSEDLRADDWFLAASDGEIVPPPQNLPFEMLTVPKHEFEILQWVLAGAFAIGNGFTAAADTDSDPTGLLSQLLQVRQEYERYLNQQQLEEINRERFENIGRVDGYYIDALWAILQNGIATEALACQREFEEHGTLRSDSFVVTITNNPNANKVSFSSIFNLAERHGCRFDGVHDDYRSGEYSRSFRFSWLPKSDPAHETDSSRQKASNMKTTA